MSSEKIPTGPSLRSLRQLAGLTLAETADIADTSVAYLSKVERGEFVPTKRYVAQVVTALGRAIAEQEKVPV